MKTCLIVEDSLPVRKIAAKMMSDLTFKVEEAADGLIALEKCQINFPDLIILDWNMPNMDGMEFLKEFRKLPNNEKTKIVFCTTNNQIEHIEMAFANGANEYIMKPFNINSLKDKLIIVGLLAL